MKWKALALVGAALCTVLVPQNPAVAQTTALTYQGRLNDGASPANGFYDLRFAIYDALSGGTQQGNALTNSATSVSNGLFTATLDLGNQFPGADRFLEIGIRTNGAGSFTTLSPRQQLTSAPYAITAANVTGVLPGGALAGTYSGAVSFNNDANAFAGNFSGNGAGVSNVNAVTLSGFSAGNFWQLGGNNVGSGQFLGSTNNQPFEVRVNGVRALRLEPTVDDSIHSNIVNMIGGSGVNSVASGVYGGTIAGGGAANYNGVGANSVAANFGTIGGGYANAIEEVESVIGGGHHNLIQSGAFDSVIGGGSANIIQSNASLSTISGGQANTNSGFWATVPGGNKNVAGGNNSFAAGHRAKATHTGSFVWADSTETDFPDTANNQFLIRAGGGVGVGTTNPVFPLTVGAPDTPLTSTAQIGAFNNGNAFVVTRQTGANVEMQLGVDNLEGVVSVVSDHPLVLRAGNGAGTGNHEYMRVNTNGFVGIGTTNPTNKLDVSGNISCSSNVFAHGVLLTSDRDAKANFATLEQETILRKVAALPLTQWNYKGEDETTKHIGPMAQDFHAAFGLNGGDDKHISVIDEGGVALAAIQGLNQKLDETRTELKRSQAENAELKRRLEALEKLMLKEPRKRITGNPMTTSE